MRDPYLKAGRLHHVLAALQVSGSAERPERTIKDWAEVLDRNRDESTIAKWKSVFEEHPEFFLTYRLPREADLKAALRVRYVSRTLIRRPERSIHLQKSTRSRWTNGICLRRNVWLAIRFRG